MRRMVALYPTAWRARYGDELDELVTLMAGEGRLTPRARLDLLAGAAREHLRSSGLAGDTPPRQRARAGTLLALCAWALFVMAGATVGKTSEHWRAVAPHGGTTFAVAAFGVLVAAGVAGAALVALGIALTLPRLAELVRAGEAAALRRPFARAVTATLIAVAATGGLVAWAHELRPAQRNGGDAAYAIAFLSWAALLCVALAAWTAAAVATARRLHLSSATIRLHAGLSMALSLLMVLGTVATVAWWVSGVAAFNARLTLASAAMLAASAVALSGARHAAAGASRRRP